MKKYTLLFAGILTLLLLQSCYDDKSTLDIHKLPEVAIDVTPLGGTEGVIRAGYLDQLLLSPKVTKEGVENHPDLSYAWMLAHTPSIFDHDTISHEPVCSFVLARAIDARPYKLWLSVVDRETTMEYMYSWNLYVESSFGEGILVAYTRDGSTSDLALVMDPAISADYTGAASIREGLYEAAAGEPVGALLRNLCYTADAYRWSNYNNVIRATKSDGGILFLNCKDYSRMDDEMIYVPANLQADKFVKTRQAWLFNGGAAGIYLMGINDKKPVMPELVHDNGGIADLNISSDSHDYDLGAPAAVWYHNGKFYRFNSAFSMPKIAAFDQTSATDAFSPANLPGQECRAAGLSTDKSLHTFLLKDTGTGNYAIYTITREINDYNYPENNRPSYGKDRIPLPASLNTLLDEAVSVFFLNDQAVMFIATARRIVPVIFAGGVVTSGTAYDVPTGETLTLARLFQQGVYMDSREMYDSNYPEKVALPLNNRAVYFATSTGSFEGNLYVVPMAENLASSGTLNGSKAIKFTGFGKILDITTQGK